MPNIRRFSSVMAGAALFALAAAGFAENASAAAGKSVCVSWRHFQEERWRIDEAGINEGLKGSDYAYVSADAQGDPQKQASDIEGLIANALIVLAQDSKAIVPSIEQAKAAHIPVIAYDVPVDLADILFISFDNVRVGKVMAEGMIKAKQNGNWALIEGDSSMAIIDLFRAGQMEVLKPLVDAGKIKIVAKQNIENWKPDVAQSTMEQILTANNNKVDAVLAMNDGMAGGVAAALAAQNMLGIPLSGQDGDVAALNRIAKGQQTVTVWKNSHDLGVAAGKAAVQLAAGKTLLEVSENKTFKTPSGIDQPAILLTPIGIMRDNLNLVVDAHWITKEKLCAGVDKDPPAACK
jgi:D-xylose transport system substrate-binding protein